MTEHDNVDPDDVQHGGVPILQHCQGCYNEALGMSYGNEQREYCQISVWITRYLKEEKANLRQVPLADQAYLICATVKTRLSVARIQGHWTSSPRVKG